MLQSMGLQRVEHDRAELLYFFPSVRNSSKHLTTYTILETQSNVFLTVSFYLCVSRKNFLENTLITQNF